MEKKKVVIIGNGAVAIDIQLALDSHPGYEVAGFAVDREFIKDPVISGHPVLPFDDRLPERYPPGEFWMHIAIGYVRINQVRADKYRQAKSWGYRLINQISDDALISPDHAHIGDNCVIGAHAIIHPQARIGNNVFIGYRCIIPHDVVLGDHSFLAANVVLGGGVRVGEYTFLGTGATVRNWVTLGRSCVIGVGAVILEDADDRAVYMATPAEKLPILSDELPLK